MWRAFIITQVRSLRTSVGLLMFVFAVSILFLNVSCDPPSSRNVAALCDSIKDIEILPMKDEPVPDPAYNALISAGEDAIPCLIRKITDETMMKDPRSAPKVGNVTVGDTAFFVLVRIGKIDQAGFLELLPPDVRKAYDEEGVYGYFRLIDEDNNRQKLQDAATQWYEKRYGRELN